MRRPTPGLLGVSLLADPRSAAVLSRRLPFLFSAVGGSRSHYWVMVTSVPSISSAVEITRELAW